MPPPPFVRALLTHAIVGAGLILLAVVHTYPLVWHLDSHTPGAGLGDNVSFIWNGWWMREALASPDVEFFGTRHLMWPAGVSLVLHTHTAFAAFVSATALGGVSVAEAQNIVIIAALALNGMTAYALALEVSGSRPGAVLAGVLYLLAAPVAARLMGHFNLLHAWTLAAGCWVLVRVCRRPSALNACALAIATAATAYADYYLAVFLALFVALYVGAELWTLRMSRRTAHATRGTIFLIGASAVLFLAALLIVVTGGGEFYLADVAVSARRPGNALTAAWLLAIAAAVRLWRPRVRLMRRVSPNASWRALTLAVAGASAATAVLLWPMLVAGWEIWTAGEYVTSAASLKSSPRGVDVATVVLGPPFHGLLGPYVRSGYAALGVDVMESAAWLGIVPLALAVWTVWRHRERPGVGRWALVALVFFVWSLGPYLTAFGRSTGLLLPQAFGQFVPLLNNARIPGRGLIVVCLAMSVLAALAMRDVQRRRTVAVLAVASLAILESCAAPLPLAELPVPGPVERRLAAAGRQAGVLPVPFGVRDGFGEIGLVDHGALYLQTFHGRPLAGGFVARLPPRVPATYQRVEPFRTLLRLSEGGAVDSRPSCAESIDGLRGNGIGFVVLNGRSAPQPAVAFIRSLPLETLVRDEFRELLVVGETAGCASARDGSPHAGLARREPASVRSGRSE